MLETLYEISLLPLALTVGSYLLGAWLQKKVKSPLCNPILVAVILLVGFLLLKIPFAPLWAALIALVDAVPLLGTGTVLIPWALVCFLQKNTARALGLLGIYTVALVSRSTMEPRLVGKQLGLDPLLTLFSLYAGFKLWGVAGMILSPVLAVAAGQLLQKKPQGG
jgi:predicted PurR-regulated permease PerM